MPRSRLRVARLDPRGLDLTRRVLVLAAASLAALLPAGAASRAAAPRAQDEPSREEWAARAIGGWLTLPDDPYGRVFAAIGGDTAPVAPPAAALAALGGADPWGADACALWAAALRRAAAGAATPADRTTLALLAAAQGRSESAWRWLASHGPGAPGHVAGALAFLVPGVPADTPIGPGGRPGPLADGARLTPLPPPRPAGTPGWQIAWRSAEFRDLAVGTARVDGKIVVESSGTEVRLTHSGGGRARLVATLAPEPGVEVGARYLDWAPRPPDASAAAEIAVGPEDHEDGDAEHVYWGRFLERRDGWPTSPPPGVTPAQLSLGGLALALAQDDPRLGAVRALARELGALLGAEVTVVLGLDDLARDAAAPARDFAPIVVHVPPGEVGTRALAALATAVETHLVP